MIDHMTIEDVYREITSRFKNHDEFFCLLGSHNFHNGISKSIVDDCLPDEEIFYSVLTERECLGNGIISASLHGITVHFFLCDGDMMLFGPASQSIKDTSNKIMCFYDFIGEARASTPDGKGVILIDCGDGVSLSVPFNGLSDIDFNNGLFDTFIRSEEGKWFIRQETKKNNDPLADIFSITDVEIRTAIPHLYPKRGLIFKKVVTKQDVAERLTNIKIIVDYGKNETLRTVLEDIGVVKELSDNGLVLMARIGFVVYLIGAINTSGVVSGDDPMYLFFEGGRYVLNKEGNGMLLDQSLCPVHNAREGHDLIQMSIMDMMEISATLANTVGHPYSARSKKQADIEDSDKSKEGLEGFYSDDSHMEGFLVWPRKDS
jgi:hypothetical protein